MFSLSFIPKILIFSQGTFFDPCVLWERVVCGDVPALSLTDFQFGSMVVREQTPRMTSVLSNLFRHVVGPGLRTVLVNIPGERERNVCPAVGPSGL